MRFSSSSRLIAAVLALAIPMLAATPQVPRPAKEFTFVDPGGKQTLLSSYKGKVVCIQFLYTTCPHCQALSKELTKLQNELGPKGVQFLGVAFDEATAGKAAAYKTQFGVGFPVAYASRDTVLSYLGLSVMDRFVVPQVMIIDKKGTIQAQSDPMGTAKLQDPSYLTQFIGGLLKDGSGAAKTSAPKAKTADPKKID
jgi:peroxiredoxin